MFTRRWRALLYPVAPSTGAPSLTRLDSLLRAFRIPRESPAVDRGLDRLTDVRADALARPRPAPDTWDLALFEGVDEP